MRPMAEFRDPCDCPTCGRGAPRASLSAPSLAGTGFTRRSLVASSERDATAAHAAGCGCCVRRWPLPSASLSKGARIFSSNGPPGRDGR
ncbi:hypothetical protein [Dankookia sp. P2]|uniref:hypothetical protein n=1 Tax=Dankookia sp. P2 TaxID=3423955 RepID=UPI003D670B0C